MLQTFNNKNLHDTKSNYNASKLSVSSAKPTFAPTTKLSLPKTTLIPTKAFTGYPTPIPSFTRHTSPIITSPVSTTNPSQRPSFLPSNLPTKQHSWYPSRSPVPEPTATIDVLYHGGLIMNTTVIKSIFWGPTWKAASYVGDQISGMSTFYIGYANSDYSREIRQYNGKNGLISSTTSFQGGSFY